MKRLRVTTWIGAVGVFTLLLLPQGCTNLDEVPKSTITPGTFFRTRGEVLAGLAGVYAQLRGAFPGYCCAYYALSEISTDEMVVPTRGQRSEEHTSELQSRLHLVCRLLLEKKKRRRCKRCDP